MRLTSVQHRSGILATLMAAVTLLAACGGSGPDEQWVAYADDMCAASEDLRGVMLTPVYPATPGAVAEAEIASQQAMRRYVQALQAADPPAELATYHEELVEFVVGLMESIEQGDREGQLGLADSLPADLPDDLDERFEAASREAEACQRLNEARTADRE